LISPEPSPSRRPPRPSCRSDHAAAVNTNVGTGVVV
jgi:hypothetical protein